MLSQMRRALCAAVRVASTLGALGALVSVTHVARAQELPRVSVSRPLEVEGLTTDPKVPDLLGMSRVGFQGVISSELRSVGYLLASEHGSAVPPLVLVGVVAEQVCDELTPKQCRIAIEWELQQQGGVVVYRTTTRAVEQQPGFEAMRRGLVQGALRSLLSRRRFALRLSDAATRERASTEGAAVQLGFVQDVDDPPFELTRRYTFGTGRAATTLRTASLVTAGLGALGVAVTWLRVRGANDLSEDAHHRLVVYNDISWGSLALGALGFGVSYALPQAHDVVAGHGSARRQLRLSVAAGGLQ
jgi:hypothetical protein